MQKKAEIKKPEQPRTAAQHNKSAGSTVGAYYFVPKRPEQPGRRTKERS